MNWSARELRLTRVQADYLHRGQSSVHERVQVLAGYQSARWNKRHIPACDHASAAGGSHVRHAC